MGCRYRVVLGAAESGIRRRAKRVKEETVWAALRSYPRRLLRRCLILILLLSRQWGSRGHHRRHGSCRRVVIRTVCTAWVLGIGRPLALPFFRSCNSLVNLLLVVSGCLCLARCRKFLDKLRWFFLQQWWRRRYSLILLFSPSTYLSSHLTFLLNSWNDHICKGKLSTSHWSFPLNRIFCCELLLCFIFIWRLQFFNSVLMQLFSWATSGCLLNCGKFIILKDTFWQISRFEHMRTFLVTLTISSFFLLSFHWKFVISFHCIVLFFLEICDLRAIICQVEHFRVVKILLFIGQKLIFLSMEKIEKVWTFDRIQVFHMWFFNSIFLDIYSFMLNSRIINSPPNGFKLFSGRLRLKIQSSSCRQVPSFLVELLVWFVLMDGDSAKFSLSRCAQLLREMLSNLYICAPISAIVEVKWLRAHNTSGWCKAKVCVTVSSDLIHNVCLTLKLFLLWFLFFLN